MQKLFMVRDIVTGEYFDDDYNEWGDYEHAGIYEKIGEQYYSGATGEMILPDNAEWVEYVLPHESAISLEDKWQK